MRHYTHGLKTNMLSSPVMLIAIFVIVIPFAILACSSSSSSTAADKASDTAAPVTGAGAMKVHKDPETGKLGTPPDTEAAPEPSEAEKRATSTSSEGLEEKPAPGGGTMVDLKGRFQATGQAAQEENAKKGDDEAANATRAKQGASHQQKAYIDPETGELGLPPVKAGVPEALEALRRAANTSSEGLEEEPAPGGGTMVDLKGRFGSVIMATKDQHGKITISHIPYPQPKSNK